jgi:short-subunit dehydrogenase
MQTILVTGASAGLGRAVALELAGRGHRLALTARRADRLEEAASAARARGAADVLVLSADLADPETPSRLVTAVVDRFGGLDVLINNAGYGLPQFFRDSAPAELRRQIDVNLTAPILIARYALPHLIESKGMLINIGSAITSVANPVYGVYGTTKAGLAYWNDALRREVWHLGVRVCLVEPGPVETDFFDAVRTLARDGSAYGTAPPPDQLYNPMRDKPPRFMTAKLEDAAHRVARLVDHPRRRLSFLRRMVWPWRLIGGLFQVVPALGDVALSGMARRIARERQ